MRIDPIGIKNVNIPVSVYKSDMEKTPSAYQNTNYINNEFREPDTSSKNDDIKISQKIRLLKKMGIIKCETCESRRYVDKSDEGNVSFKSPTKISSFNSFSAVTSHELEHVANSKAEESSNELKQITSQSVRIFTDICPECGRVYASGGETKTDMKIKNDSELKGFVEKSFGIFNNGADNEKVKYVMNDFG